MKRVVALPNIKTDTKLTVSYEDPEHLPDGVSNPDIASYLITGMEGVMEKYAATGKVRSGQLLREPNVLAVDRVTGALTNPSRCTHQ